MIPLTSLFHFHYLFAPPLSQAELPFPLNQARTRYYYFARNGIWEGIRSMGLKPGDEVFMPAYNSGIETDTVIAYGLQPIFYPVDARLYPDWDFLTHHVTSRSKLFYLIHYFGFPQPLEEAKLFCKNYGLLFFEDVAQGFLSNDTDNQPLGSAGDAAIFCPRKMVPIPHGGLLVINNPSLPFPSSFQKKPSQYSTIGETVSLMLKNGATKGGLMGNFSRRGQSHILPTIKRVITAFGITHTESAGPEFEPAKTDWGMAQLSRYLLKRFDYAEVIRKRRRNYQLLITLLQPLHGKTITLVHPDLPPYTCPMDCMILTSRRDQVIHALAKRDIQTSKLWWWPRPLEIGAPYPRIMDILHRNILLSVHQDLSEDDIRCIANTLTDLLNDDRLRGSK